MDWSNEPWVRLYTRETDDDLVLSWQARAVWHEMIKKFDRSGLIALKRGRRGLAALIRHPLEVVEAAIPELLEDGRICELEVGYFAPNFLEAQEAPSSDPQRKRESRQKRRDIAAAEAAGLPVTKRDAAVTNRDGSRSPVTKRDAAVTNRDEMSGDPGLRSLLPDLEDLTERSSPARALAIPPSTEHQHQAQAQPPEPPKTDPASPPYDETAYSPDRDPRQAGRLAEWLWAAVSADRLLVAGELGTKGVLPFPAAGTGAEPGAFRELRARIREEGRSAPRVCSHVRAALLERARDEKSIEWLAEKSFTEGGWRTARGYVLGQRKKPKPGEHAPTLRIADRDEETPPPMRGAGGTKP